MLKGGLLGKNPSRIPWVRGGEGRRGEERGGEGRRGEEGGGEGRRGEERGGEGRRVVHWHVEIDSKRQM